MECGYQKVQYPFAVQHKCASSVTKLPDAGEVRTERRSQRLLLLHVKVDPDKKLTNQEYTNILQPLVDVHGASVGCDDHRNETRVVGRSERLSQVAESEYARFEDDELNLTDKRKRGKRAEVESAPGLSHRSEASSVGPGCEGLSRTVHKNSCVICCVRS
ncbi:unnamed protein product [Soboliphyme baturini]|uniref:Uncharacterized protein n=1 Tax=Soboliphyme baturini TaxID=241478 RepID=A0A183IW45_9BILA|nr:unnamed protein product [Soboliphyme baturini]